MGIYLLNNYIKSHSSSNSIEIINLSNLSGKIISVDISIYLHKFLAEGDLFENLYLMFSLIKYYNIRPIFVFDGKPPPEKYELIQKRQLDRITAKNNYLKIIQDNNTTISNNEIINLKRKFMKPTKNDIIITQNLISAFGFIFLEAEGEADIVCAKLVIKKYAFACLSEDMDLFVYGCPRILRYLSLSNENCVIYNLHLILKDINLTFNEFKEICILAGTDYNNSTNTKEINIPKAIELLNEYKSYKIKNIKYNKDFYTWISDNYKIIDNIFNLYNICNMFETNTINIKKLNYNLDEKIDVHKIKEIMKPHGFIFV